MTIFHRAPGALLHRAIRAAAAIAVLALAAAPAAAQVGKPGLLDANIGERGRLRVAAAA